jgi:hypothetical protein
MVRTYNIGTECYALITSPNEPEFLLPVKVVLLEKYRQGGGTTYKVKIKEIFETDINYLKEHFGSVKVSMNLKSANLTTLLRKSEVDSVKTMSELIQKLNDKQFYLEENYITLDKNGLIDIYNKFVKYIINYHFRKLYQLTSRTFLANQPVFNNQKDVFLRRVESLGFGDIFKKYDLKLDI